MSDLVFNLIEHSLREYPGHDAIAHKKSGVLTYQELAALIENLAAALHSEGIRRYDRIGIYLPKVPEAVIGMLAASRCGATFVPINPLLKPEQVEHILTDCDVKCLITSPERAQQLAESLGRCPALTYVIVTAAPKESLPVPQTLLIWDEFIAAHSEIETRDYPTMLDVDMAAILYTSGSTGKPKGVVLSHRNIVVGARSVAEYLDLTHQDRLLAVLPFSFDYGLNQLTSSLLTGACCYLMDYLLPNDVIKAVAREKITGLAAVPPLWNQVADLDWPDEAVNSLRYITNSGGAMPEETLQKLRARLPKTRPFLMYGLTEAFRSTYLDPDKIDERKGSMGKAIPNAEIMVVRDNGELCGPDEPGELVHRGALVAMGYWNDPERTNERFKPAPLSLSGIPTQELAVWSGDTVQYDKDGYLYFIGRTDGMIKTSGYRVSPEEVEACLYASGLVDGAAAIGVAHPQLGQAIIVVATSKSDADDIDARLMKCCQSALPNFMVPRQIIIKDHLPHNPNGKIDRNSLKQEYGALYDTTSS